MKQKRRLFPLFLFLFFLSGVLAFGYTKGKAWLFPPTHAPPIKKSAATGEPVVLGSFLNSLLPPVGKDNFSSPGADLKTLNLKNVGENLTLETEKITKSILNNVTDAVKEAVISNISINQEKIIQDVTAKLLKSLLSQAGTTAQPVDRAVYDACTDIIKKEKTYP